MFVGSRSLAWDVDHMGYAGRLSGDRKLSGERFMDSTGSRENGAEGGTG